MKTKKWIGFDFEREGWSDNHENRNDAYVQFARDFRSDLKTMLKGTGWTVLPYKAGWFDFSGFLYNEEKDRYVYFSISDVRYRQDEWFERVLIRTAKHDKDWTGGGNHFCRFTEIPEVLTWIR